MIINGDALTHLSGMTANHVQTCITSPPYYGLRDYGVNGQIGLEETPSEYVRKLVEVFCEVRRTLRDDGTLWIVIGDSYASDGGTNHQGKTGERHKRTHTQRRLLKNSSGLRPKNLMGIPWRLAFALQEDGWILRQEIIWSKPNPMPESVTDRCTKSHETIFLLSKSEQYYFDHLAIQEPAIYAGLRPDEKKGAFKAKGEPIKGQLPFRAIREMRNKRSVWEVQTRAYPGAHFATYPMDLIEPMILSSSRPGDTVLDPFTGSGTTGACAGSHGRRFVGIELNPEYCGLAVDRLGLFGGFI